MSVSTDTTANATIRTFQIDVPDEVVADLRRRVAATRRPDRETVADQSQGAQLAKMPLISGMGPALSESPRPNTSRTPLRTFGSLAVLPSPRVWLVRRAWRDWRGLAALFGQLS